MKKFVLNLVLCLGMIGMLCGCGGKSESTASLDPEDVNFHGGKYYYGFSPLSFSTLDTLEFVSDGSNTATGKVVDKDETYDYTVRGDKVSYKIPFHTNDNVLMFYMDKYLVDTSMLLAGKIPDEQYFEVKCKYKNGDSEYKIFFYKDGSCKLKSDVEREGTYKRETSEIKVTFNDEPGVTYNYLIYNGKLTYSYLKLWTEDENYVLRKRMEVMVYVKSRLDPLNYANNMTKEEKDEKKQEVWGEVMEKYGVDEYYLNEVMNDAELMKQYYNHD